MKKFRFTFLSSLLLCIVATLFIHYSRSTAAQQPQSREDAYRANNLGVAMLEQFKYKEAVDAFRRALQIDPKVALARINLSIALYNVPDLAASQREAISAASAAPEAPQPYYILGLIAKTQNRTDDAISAFQHVLKIDPTDSAANINLGQAYALLRKYPEAIAAFRLALATEPYNGTALYNLGQALLRAGQREEGQQVIARFQEFRQRGSGTTLGTSYLEQGRYAEAVASTGAEMELVDKTVPAVSFSNGTAVAFPDLKGGGTSATGASPVVGRRFKGGELTDSMRSEIASGLGGCATLFDFDLDGDLDLIWGNGSEIHLFRNDNGRFADITAQAGALSSKFIGTITGAVAGDYDNDGKPDIFVVGDSHLSLYHNDANGKFSDVSATAGIPAFPFLPSSVAFVDVDHDGDLDIFITGLADLSKPATGNGVFPQDFAPAKNLLLRNDANGKFTDITAAAKLDQPGRAVEVVPTDFNNRRDIDLLVVNYGSAPALYSNQRDGTFRNVASETGLSADGAWTCVAAGDVNKDGYTDFMLGRGDGPALFALSDGREKFKLVAAPAGSTGARAAQFLDYDNDGLLDCVLLTDKGVRVIRNVGDGWVDTSDRAIGSSFAGLQGSSGRLFASGDLDGDGDTDLLMPSASGDIIVGRNDGGSDHNSLRIRLAGKVSNRSGVGSKVEARAGSLVQKLETYSASPSFAASDTIFGLGKRNAVDAVRVLWPAGIVQAETEISKVPPAKAGGSKNNSLVDLPVVELDRKPSSCPYLYAWNGERFEFITDFMGGGEMGYLEEPGRYNKPDPDEYVRIRGDQLKERNGKYELRVTNELEETMFVDKLQLIAVAHRQDVEVYPNEGMSEPPRPFVLYKTKGAHAPLAAVDDHGHDVLPEIARMDRWYPDDFRRDSIRGYADEHALTLKLDNGIPAGRKTLLLLTGWTDYSWSSDNVAATQAGKEMKPPALQVKDARGKWKTVIDDIGIPVGRPQTVTVDLTGKFLSASREVRIVTNMRALWDQVLVDTSTEDFAVTMTRLNPVAANLRWRGFSREVTPDGREPFGYDYTKVSFSSPWKVMPGRYTREGDVRELLTKVDDIFVISRPGDEISLSFDATKLAPLPEGWTRTFLLYADGFSKEMDINSASPDQVSPLPFHGMSRYPYGANESYPMTAPRREYMDRYNTRVVRSQVPSIDSVLLERIEEQSKQSGSGLQAGGSTK